MTVTCSHCRNFDCAGAPKSERYDWAANDWGMCKLAPSWYRFSAVYPRQCGDHVPDAGKMIEPREAG